jgi:dihydroorotase
MNKILFKEATLFNEGQRIIADILVEGERIVKIESTISAPGATEVLCSGLLLMPGMIDDQVHFREPGLTHKATIFSESRAAAAGGITSYMEMPNTIPATLSHDLLEEKYSIAAKNSWVNYSFYLGTSMDNLEAIKAINPQTICGLKIFMGSSTGNMLVDNPEYLEQVFRSSPVLIALHCESDPMIALNLEKFKSLYGDEITAKMHPQIRNAEACFTSSSMAVHLANSTGARIHILHISTEKEFSLFSEEPLSRDKKITAEACVHHLWFTEADYTEKGNFIKWNPAIKSENDRNAIRAAVNSGKIDVLATDHAPHTLEEKSKPYLQASSGGPLVQHALPALLELVKQGVFSYETVVTKMAHAPATLFSIKDRGFIREGYFADLVLVAPDSSNLVTKDNVLYKCGWSPFEGTTFSHKVISTYVNGQKVFEEGNFTEPGLGKRLEFNR